MFGIGDTIRTGEEIKWSPFFEICYGLRGFVVNVKIWFSKSAKLVHEPDEPDLLCGRLEHYWLPTGEAPLPETEGSSWGFQLKGHGCYIVILLSC